MNDFNAESFYLQVGRRLKQERLRLGLSQAEFASKGGVSRATQYLYESGDRVPSMEYLARVLLIGADLGVLIYGERGAAERAVPLDSKLRTAVFKLIEGVARDQKGHLLPAEHRLALFDSLCTVLAGQSESEVDWDSIRATLKIRSK